jgi:hypothetical protein
MSKMTVDPEMYMKTKEGAANCPRNIRTNVPGRKEFSKSERTNVSSRTDFRKTECFAGDAEKGLFCRPLPAPNMSTFIYKSISNSEITPRNAGRRVTPPRFLLTALKAALVLLISFAFCTSALAAGNLRSSQSLNGTWNLWFDANVDWQHEKLVLSPKSLGDIPTHAPTIGWEEMLKAGKPFPVPATWDETDPHHHGVGWYWRQVRIPTAARGMVIQLRFAAVRERAEVYWNGRLLGYSLEGFTPFMVDVTKDVRYGEDNLLAVRVTNPGGGYSWMDFNPIPWGDVRLPDSHDFGGIWQDVDLLIVPPMHIQNVYAAPLEDLHTLSVTAEVANAGPLARKGLLSFEVYAAGESKPVARGKAEVSVPANNHATSEMKIQIPNAQLWSPETPNLYRLVTRLDGSGARDQVETQVGVRYFTEKDGRLFLNNHRVVVRSSINFGFYPYTVAYPSRELAEKEVRAAKGLGLNTLSCHRTCCTPALLDAADRLGLMIYEEPGGAPRERAAEPQTPAEAFERQAFLEKLRRLVVRDRNHPALIWWNMANEAFGDKVDDPQHLKPYIDELMHETHRLDPSRFVTYTSAKQSTVMFRPFETVYGLIYDGHTVLNEPAVWRDVLTLEHSTFRAPLPGEVFYNGESRNLDSLGDLPGLAAKFAKAPAGSYEANWAHWAELLRDTFARYDLGRYFKNPSELCRLIGLQQGSGFSREVESLRLSDAASGLALNGWESHSGAYPSGDYKSKIDGQWTSGLLDPLRDYNFPPEMLARANEPVHLAVVPLPGVAYVGGKVEVDVTLINERQVKGAGKLALSITAPDGNTQLVSDEQVEVRGDSLKFVQQLLQTAVAPSGPSGYYRLRAELKLNAGQTFRGEQSILAEKAAEWKLPASGIQLEDPTHTLGKYFEARTIFYPDLASPSHVWQPVVMIYNPEGGDFDSRYWSAKGLTEEVSVLGRTALLWAADPAHGKTITDLLRQVHVLPDDAQVLLLGMHWFGGWEFNTPHPIFSGLPAPVIFDNYLVSAYAYWGITNFPGTMIAGMLNAPPQLAVTLGELRFGKGKILVCAMNLLPYLDKDPVADRILAQMLNYAVNTATIKGGQ